MGSRMATRSCLPELVLLLLVSSAASGLGSVLVRTMSQISALCSWSASQSACRSITGYEDLATLHMASDEARLNLYPFFVWVGLQQNLLGQWSWVNRQAVNTSRLPVGTAGLLNSCAYYSFLDDKFYISPCDNFYFFICSKLNASNIAELTFINESMTWANAQLYCQKGFDDLAASYDDVQLHSAASQQGFPVWIGLYRNGQTWNWSAGVSDYRHWAPNEPGNGGDCVAVSSQNKMMMTYSCSAHLPFVCFKDNLLLLKEEKTWEDALDHCRALNSQLVSVQPGDDFTYMSDAAMEAASDEVWTGLRFLAGQWFWTNGAAVQLPGLPPCPPDGQRCAAFSRLDSDALAARDCSETKNFLCYRLLY